MHLANAEQRLSGQVTVTTENGPILVGEKFELELTAGEPEWLWLLVENSYDEHGLVFGTVDPQPVAATDVKLGEKRAVSYDHVSRHPIVGSSADAMRRCPRRTAEFHCPGLSCFNS